MVGTTGTQAHRNVIGTHSGSYGVYRALAVAAGALSPQHRADLTNTAPTDVIGPYPQWQDPAAIVSLDPWGAAVADVFAAELEAGQDIRPTIAVTKAARHAAGGHGGDAAGPAEARRPGAAAASGAAVVTKVAVEPVWHLPGVARTIRLHRVGEAAPGAVRGDRRHVPRTRHPRGSRGVPAADRRSDAVYLRRPTRSRRIRTWS